jgi:hypothetical protein
MDRNNKHSLALIGLLFILIVGGVFYGKYIPFQTDSLIATAETAFSTNCSNNHPVHTSLAQSDDPILQKLAEYEAVCHGSVVDQLMMFAAMPTSETEASQSATDITSELKDFAVEGITPLVVFEPSSTSPTVITDIKNGTYDTVTSDYYRLLKKQGVTDAQMGTWVLFPEANSPSWEITDPATFTANVTKVATMQKQVFPDSKVSIMLNSETYPDNDVSWSHGAYKSLVPYVTNIPKGLVDSFGLQGFPEPPQANEPRDNSQLVVSHFLPVNLAANAAKQLGTSDIWLNTGTFKHMYTNDPAAEVSLSTAQRQSMLDSIATAAEQLKQQSFHVSVNLFAQDKSQTDENTDWSYWQTGHADTSPDTHVFDMFVRQLRASGIGFSLYDQVGTN